VQDAAVVEVFHFIGGIDAAQRGEGKLVPSGRFTVTTTS
jgi:hypothetical protein